jgi:glycosyltransferase involved in cell wall biosynthesis
MQNKLQEALAMEVPAVTTTVAADGLRVANGAEVPVAVADEDDLFVQRVVDLLVRPEERALLAAKGRLYAERHFSWTRSTEQLEQMCLNAVASNGWC